MDPEETRPSEAAAWQEQERFALEAGKRMSLRSRLLWLEEMHDLVLRWSRKRPMMYPDGTVLAPPGDAVHESPAADTSSTKNIAPSNEGGRPAT